MFIINAMFSPLAGSSLRSQAPLIATIPTHNKTMSQSKPSIIIVPGSFSLPEFYDAVTDRVASKGYEIKAIRLRSTEKLQQPATMYDDAAAIASEVAALVDQGKEVILVAHSYGGVPASESIKGLAKTEDSGKAGGIVNLAYLTAVVPELGASSADVLADIPTENRVELQLEVGLALCLSHPTLALTLGFSFVLWVTVNENHRMMDTWLWPIRPRPLHYASQTSQSRKARHG